MREKKNIFRISIIGVVIHNVVLDLPIIDILHTEIVDVLRKIKYFEGQKFDGINFRYYMGMEYGKKPISVSRSRKRNRHINYSIEFDAKDLEDKKLYEYADIRRIVTYDGLIYIAEKYKISKDKIKKLEEYRDSKFEYQEIEPKFMNMKVKKLYDIVNISDIEMLERVDINVENNLIIKIYLMIKYFIFRLVRNYTEENGMRPIGNKNDH